MTFQTALMTVGHYLLLAVGLILLLFILILAVAFLLTLFMRFFADISLKTAGGKIQTLISLRFKILFYEIDLLYIDTFDDESDSNIDSDSDSESNNSEPDKNTYHVTLTDEKISVQTIESRKHSSEYEIIIHTEETGTKDIKISDGVQTVTLDSSEIVSETEDIITYDEDEFIEAEIETELENESTETVETTVIDYEFEGDASRGGDAADSDGTVFTEENDDGNDDDYDVDYDDDDETDDDEFDFDFSDSYDEIKRYVDLSDPEQFVSDSMGAAVRVSKASARFVSDLLLRAKIDEMSADVIYGLSDPANTALSFGAVHSFKASVYAYMADVEEKSRSSKRRKKAAEIGKILRDDIQIVPDMTQETFEADTDASFSFWMPRLYIPTLRFLLNKNTRWTLRHYLYPYFIRQYIRTWKAERKQRKAEQKAEKKSDSAVSS
ncbi:DUF2953 domain-containing protein [Methanimicrococcus blatticola]|uniref:Uncharacterized protein n=1 Tax=Methanimicrococcus blatticola TaxID=91560 RepID=A0A484F4N4_9EURY|nr:DUF2953 domain-containing protein [Methanimicrococcus blatticola]MBZ3936197.1 DUF2953 domain-containing protein [Methanimicrococcus blatticola]MCC2508440.1 DUF2953 domain-containing protein [Methanimicrococcus blatticola]TDQ70107.1 hypothetical protein C7391_0445 [Methanimicrococcus blatticola]